MTHRPQVTQVWGGHPPCPTKVKLPTGTKDQLSPNRCTNCNHRLYKTNILIKLIMHAMELKRLTCARIYPCKLTLEAVLIEKINVHHTNFKMGTSVVYYTTLKWIERCNEEVGASQTSLLQKCMLAIEPFEWGSWSPKLGLHQILWIDNKKI
jgi:hypothetical protein